MRTFARADRRSVLQGTAVFAAILVVTVAIGSAGQSRAAGSGFVGSPAPGFALETIDGERVSLADLRGRPVWLNFFSSWCTRCRAENPDIQELYEEARASGSDLAIVGIAANESTSSVADYADNAGLRFPIASDADGSVSRRYLVFAIPTHVFIDRDGTVRELRIGGLRPEVMRALVAEIAPELAQR